MRIAWSAAAQAPPGARPTAERPPFPPVEVRPPANAQVLTRTDRH